MNTTVVAIAQLDISLVLDTLCRRELSNQSLSLHQLTAKTVFLLALASGERRHALVALAYPPSVSACQVTLRFNQNYVLFET